MSQEPSPEPLPSTPSWHTALLYLLGTAVGFVGAYVVTLAVIFQTKAVLLWIVITIGILGAAGVLAFLLQLLSKWEWRHRAVVALALVYGLTTGALWSFWPEWRTLLIRPAAPAPAVQSGTFHH